MKYIRIENTENVLKEFEKSLSKFRGKGRFNFSYELPTPKVDNLPIVCIHEKVYLKMLNYVMLYDKEIAWHGTVERNDNMFDILDVFLYPQTVTSVTVETDQEEYVKFINKLDGEVLNKMRFQGHSHVDMGVSPSITDLNYYDEILAQIPDDDYYIFFIMNKKRQVFINIYDLANNIQYETADITFKVYNDDFEDIETKITEEIKSNVNVYKPAPKKKASAKVFKWNEFKHLYEDPKTYYESDEFWAELDNKYNQGVKK